MDVLSDVLKRLHLRGTVYCKAQFQAPWGMVIEKNAVAAFHFVSRGGCWLHRKGEHPMHLPEGSIVVFPRGLTHSLSDSPTPSDGWAQVDTCSNGPVVPPAANGHTPSTQLICGHFEYDMGAQHPMISSLPDMLHTQADPGAERDWFQTAAQLAALESEREQKVPGTAALVERLAETLLIQIIRDHASGEDAGYLAALAHDGLAKALHAIHEFPHQAWTVESLGRIASMSRSSFAGHFRQLVGTSPMQYATLWRMHVARDLLLSESTNIAAIAKAVGYSDEFAFAKAFKRMFEESPSNLRRRMQVHSS